MITKDNIDKYLEAVERRHLTNSKLYIQAKNRLEELRGLLEDDEAELKDLRETKESFKN